VADFLKAGAFERIAHICFRNRAEGGCLYSVGPFACILREADYVEIHTVILKKTVSRPFCPTEVGGMKRRLSRMILR